MSLAPPGTAGLSASPIANIGSNEIEESGGSHDGSHPGNATVIGFGGVTGAPAQRTRPAARSDRATARAARRELPQAAWMARSAPRVGR